jgi:methylaspartate ammonia-lyase
MHITDVVSVPVRAGFFTDDQAAIRGGAPSDGFLYRGSPLTPGFTSIREPGEAISVLLVLSDGQVAQGDCAGVQYQGVGGRDRVFRAVDGVDVLERVVAPALLGAELTDFPSLAARLEALTDGGDPLHTALRYGVSQALLDAVARARGVTMAEVVRDDYATELPIEPVPMFVQSGDDRYATVDRMVLKKSDALPHGLVNNAAARVGPDGALLLEYVAWVRDRVLALRPDPLYRPVLHFDVYGTVGAAFDGDVERVADHLARLAEVAAPFPLRVEQPLDGGSRDGHIAVSLALREALSRRGAPVEIVVDEWCNTLEDIALFVEAGAADVVHVKTPDLGGIGNTVEALLLVTRGGLGAYCGGTCNETDRSAQVSAHVAMACGAVQVLAKPGMGVDEGLMIVGNEMARVAALVAARKRLRSR